MGIASLREREERCGWRSDGGRGTVPLARASRIEEQLGCRTNRRETAHAMNNHLTVPPKLNALFVGHNMRVPGCQRSARSTLLRRLARFFGPLTRVSRRRPQTRQMPQRQSAAVAQPARRGCPRGAGGRRNASNVIFLGPG